MSTLGDSWGSGPERSTSVPQRSTQNLPPPPPGALQTPTQGAWSNPSTSRPGSFEAAEGWQRVGAIIGIVWSFFFLLTIPGWLTLAHYKKWKRGEITTPHGLIWWGYGFSALMVIIVVASAMSPSP